MLNWENCGKVYLQGNGPVESFCLSVRVVLCCMLLVQDISVRMRDVNTRFNHITLCVLFLNYWDRIHFSYGLRYLLLLELLLISLAHCINKGRIEYALDQRCRWLRKKSHQCLRFRYFSSISWYGCVRSSDLYCRRAVYTLSYFS